MMRDALFLPGDIVQAFIRFTNSSEWRTAIVESSEKCGPSRYYRVSYELGIKRTDMVRVGHWHVRAC